MDKIDLFAIADNMKEALGTEQFLNALFLSLDSDTLEDHLRYIDRMYETNCF